MQGTIRKITMTEYTIFVNRDYMTNDYIAVFDDYDGAPDGNNTYGRGTTHQEAIADLVEHYDFKE